MMFRFFQAFTGSNKSLCVCYIRLYDFEVRTCHVYLFGITGYSCYLVTFCQQLIQDGGSNESACSNQCYIIYNYTY